MWGTAAQAELLTQLDFPSSDYINEQGPHHCTLCRPEGLPRCILMQRKAVCPVCPGGPSAGERRHAASPVVQQNIIIYIHVHKNSRIKLCNLVLQILYSRVLVYIIIVQSYKYNLICNLSAICTQYCNVYN